jgi:hypothetical protein
MRDVGQWTKKKANRGPRLTPEGLRRRHPRRGGKRGGMLFHQVTHSSQDLRGRIQEELQRRERGAREVSDGGE